MDPVNWTYQQKTGTYTAPGGWLIQPGEAWQGRWMLLRHGQHVDAFDRLVEAKASAEGITAPVRAAELPPPDLIPFTEHRATLEVLAHFYVEEDTTYSRLAGQILDRARREGWVA